MISAARIRELLNNPPPPGFEFIAETREYEKEILNGWTMETIKYGFELDSFCPAKLGQLTVIVGHPNVGKTTILLYLFSLLLKMGRRLLIYSAENRISTLHKQLTRFVTGQEYVTEAMLSTVRDSVRYIKHEKHFSYREMLEQATYLLDADYNYDFFLIDPYNSLRIDNPNRLNMHDYHYAACDEMRIFTTATNKSIFLNCHTVTESQRVKLDANGRKPVPLDSDVEGGGKFINKADDTMVFHRHTKSVDETERFITEIHVTKVRNQEFGGQQTPFENPVKIKFRLNRTGFDVVGSYDEKVNDYKQMNFYESTIQQEIEKNGHPFG